MIQERREKVARKTENDLTRTNFRRRLCGGGIREYPPGTSRGGERVGVSLRENFKEGKRTMIVPRIGFTEAIRENFPKWRGRREGS